MASANALVISLVLMIAVVECRHGHFSEEPTFNHTNTLSDNRNDTGYNNSQIAHLDSGSENVNYNKYNFNDARREQQDPSYDSAAEQQEYQQGFEKDSVSGNEFYAGNDMPRDNYRPRQQQQEQQSFDEKDYRNTNAFYSGNHRYHDKFRPEQEEETQGFNEKNSEEIYSGKDMQRGNYPEQEQEEQSFNEKNSREGAVFSSDNVMHRAKADNYYPPQQQEQRQQSNDYPQQEQHQQSFKENNSTGGELFSEEEETGTNMQRDSQRTVPNRLDDEPKSSVLADADANSNGNDYEFQQRERSGGFSNYNNFGGKQQQQAYNDLPSSGFQDNNENYNEPTGRRYASPNGGNYGYGRVDNFDAKTTANNDDNDF